MISSDWDTSRIDYRALKDEWHVVAHAEGVAENAVKSVRLLGEDLVLWRSEGAIHAWKDYCLHRGARLSLGSVKGGRLACPYHGWEYGGDGRCERYPSHPQMTPSARTTAFTHHAKERYGYIWVNIGEPRADVPDFPQWDDETFRKVHSGPYPCRANALRAIENFLDPTHFPFVHANLNASSGNPDPIDDYDVKLGERGLESSEITLFQPSGDHRGIPVTATYKYYCFRPTAAYFNKKTGETERFCMLMTVTPCDLDQCVAWQLVAINFGWDLSVEQIRSRQDTVFGQDLCILESQRPAPLPLDDRAEYHLRSDRLGLEYRRWIRALGGNAPPL